MIMNGEVIGVSTCMYVYLVASNIHYNQGFRQTYIDSSYGCLLKRIIRIWPCVCVSAVGGGPIGTGV